MSEIYPEVNLATGEFVNEKVHQRYAVTPAAVAAELDQLVTDVTTQTDAAVAAAGAAMVGAVRHDAAQVLGDAERSRARGNIGAREGLERVPPDPGLAHAVTDAEARVLLGWRPDGSTVVGGGLEVLGALDVPGSFRGSLSQTADPDVTGYERVWVDEADRVILGVRPDGRVHIPALESQLDPPGMAPAVALLGHSMLAGASSAIIAAIPEATVTGLAVGGEGSATIAARQGGQPHTLLPVGGSIPASGPVQVTIRDASGGPTGSRPMLQGPTSYQGWLVLLDGTRLPGTFAINRAGASPSFPDSTWSFARTTAGSAVPLARPVPFYYDQAEAARSAILVSWSGRNSLTAPDQVVADTEAMILHQTSGRWLVLGECTGDGETTGTVTHGNVATVNERLRSIAGRRFIDVRRYLIDYGLADAGITPTSQDTTDIAGDTVPASLRTDSIHLTAAGSAIVAQLIRRRLLEMGWI